MCGEGAENLQGDDGYDIIHCGCEDRKGGMKAARIKQRRSGAQACCVTAQTPANPEVRAGRESSRVRKRSRDFCLMA